MVLNTGKLGLCGPCPFDVYGQAGKVVEIIFHFPEIWLYLPRVSQDLHSLEVYKH